MRLTAGSTRTTDFSDSSVATGKSIYSSSNGGSRGRPETSLYDTAPSIRNARHDAGMTRQSLNQSPRPQPLAPVTPPDTPTDLGQIWGSELGRAWNASKHDYHTQQTGIHETGSERRNTSPAPAPQRETAQREAPTQPLRYE
jgi:hypothetical protein